MSVIAYLKTVLIAQLFYAFAITMVIYALPAASLTHVIIFQQPATNFSERYIAAQVEENITQQINLPVIELATLVFYSGNIVLDLLLNFATAVPQMFTLLINGFLLMFNVDAALATQIKLFFMVMIGLLYIIAIITFLLGIRARGTVV